MIDPTPGEPFEWPGRGLARPCYRRLDCYPDEWTCADGARMRRYHATAWQAQRKGYTTRWQVSATDAIEALRALEDDQ